METFSTAERVAIIEIYYKHRGNISDALQTICDVFPQNNLPTMNIVKDLVKNFEETGSVNSTHTAISPHPDCSTRDSGSVKNSRCTKVKVTKRSLKKIPNKETKNSTRKHSIEDESQEELSKLKFQRGKDAENKLDPDDNSSDSF